MAQVVESGLSAVESTRRHHRKIDQARHRARTSAQDRYLTLSTRWLRQTTALQLAHDLVAVFGIRISRQTIYGCLAETRLYTRHPILCDPLTAFYRKVRLLWRRNHSWTPQELGRVLFSDDSRFTRPSDSRRVFIWK
ncbi:transposable element Tcb1 transposase [Trichonephila clavipes]|nr:transposable element Tcb1 transposase [Trichonephila clavipes]